MTYKVTNSGTTLNIQMISKGNALLPFFFCPDTHDKTKLMFLVILTELKKRFHLSIFITALDNLLILREAVFKIGCGDLGIQVSVRE